MFDSHAHLFDKKLTSSVDINHILEQLKNLKFNGIVCICETEPELDLFLNYSSKYEFLYCCVGIHPHNAKEYNYETLKRLVNKAVSSNKLVAIGETGLDFYYNLSSKEKQVEVFISHIKLAKELSLPLVIHSRNSNEEVYEILLEQKVNHAIMHCFDGDINFANKILELGLFISFSGVITFKNNKNLDVVKHVPLEKILVETDTPYLSPEPYRGKINTPLNLPYIIHKIAEIKNLDFEHVEKIIDTNSGRAFNLSLR